MSNSEHKRRTSLSSSCVNSAAAADQAEELRHMPLVPQRLMRDSGGAGGCRKRLSKQLSMCETSRDVAWERRRRQFLLLQERRRNGIMMSNGEGEHELTDEDLSELKGCIELGFGFNEEDGQKLCGTLPALDLYFAVNRQLSLSPVSTPKSRLSTSSSSAGRSSPFGSPRSDSDTWKICSPGIHKALSIYVPIIYACFDVQSSFFIFIFIFFNLRKHLQFN